MPKRTDIKKILIIGSGPIVIGQACEFDYSGTQALKVLRQEGFDVVLVNSNPATIMTDPEMANATYVEPLIPEVLERIIEKERPDALLPTLGGQTALNLAVALSERGTLKRFDVELIGASLQAIKKAEDRRLFKKTMVDIGLHVPKSGYAVSLSEAEAVAKEIGFPLIIRPSFTLGGQGSSQVFSKDEFLEAAAVGMDASPIHEILIEESIVGWKEFELEVMRDGADNCVVICAIENLDPMGVHTGDSITVAPAQTLTDKEYQKMREAAFACMRAIGVDTGGSNVQFALHPKTGRMVIIEMNPRVSRSSALASKATGFPIAKLAALLAVGYRLDEIPNDITQKTMASFEPTIDYVVTKIPRFAFEKFTNADQTLSTAMKSVGEVMALGRTFKESFQKAIRGLETGRLGFGPSSLDYEEKLSLAKDDPVIREVLLEEIRAKLTRPNCDRIYFIRHALKLEVTEKDICQWTQMDPWFIRQMKEIVDLEERLGSYAPKSKKTKGFFHRGKPPDLSLWRQAKQMGFSDAQLASLTGLSAQEVRKIRKKAGLLPTYKAVDTCAAEFPAYTPYFYSTYEQEDEVVLSPKDKVVILGGGPNRIGQGIEFDYCCVHAAMALREEGYETIMVNCNPETVSTDYDTSDILFFEPLTTEDVLNIVDRIQPKGIIVQFGGQTPLNLADSLKAAGVKILGTSVDSIDLAEDRGRFGKLLDRLKIPQAPNGTAFSEAQAKRAAERIGYPVMVRPSYVLGGRAMEVVYDEASLSSYIQRAAEVSPEKPILIDKFLDNALEVDVDALSDGKAVYIGGIMEHIEQAGIHSGDSACVLPPRTLSDSVLARIKDHTTRLAQALKVKGLLNIQFAVRQNVVYVLEVNPRASRTVPFVSKATGVPLAKLAAKVMVGKRLKDLALPKQILLKHVAVKEAVLPWARFPGVDAVLGPEMRSTGEVMGIDRDFPQAFAKSQAAAGSMLPKQGTILLSLRDSDKKEALPYAVEFSKLGFHLMATAHTAEFLRSQGLEVKDVCKLSEGRPHVVDVIKNKQVVLILNTPSGKGSRSDGYEIRRAALLYNVPILTTLAAARAALEAMAAQRSKVWEVSPLQSYYVTTKEEKKVLA